MDTKEKILQIAYQVFINNGFHNTSMQQLVEAANMSKGAFYHHFKNKKELYEQVINRYFLSFYQAIDWSVYHNKSLRIAEIEAEIHRFYLHFVPEITRLTENGMSRYYIMYFEAYSLLPVFKETVQSFYNQLEKLLINAIDNVQKPSHKATQIIAKYEGILFLLAVNPNLKLEQLLDQVKHTH